MTAKVKDGIKLPLKKAKKHIMDMYTANILNFKREQNVLSFFIKSQKLRYNNITERKDIKNENNIFIKQCHYNGR